MNAHVVAARATTLPSRTSSVRRMHEACLQSVDPGLGAERLADRDLRDVVDLVPAHDEHRAEASGTRRGPSRSDRECAIATSSTQRT